jgi:hypothetical protein
MQDVELKQIQMKAIVSKLLFENKKMPINFI